MTPPMTDAAASPAPPPSGTRRGRPAASPSDQRRRRVAIERGALQCLAHKGFAELSVDEIAAAAGVSRRTFYRSFASKRQLFAHILRGRAIAMGAAVKRLTDARADFAEAVVDGTMETLRLIDADATFRALVEADSGLMVELINLDLAAPEESLFLATWREVFGRARDAGVLRGSIDDDAAADWLRTIHFLLTLRPDLDDDAKRALLLRFVVPSLTLHEPG